MELYEDKKLNQWAACYLYIVAASLGQFISNACVFSNAFVLYYWMDAKRRKQKKLTQAARQSLAGSTKMLNLG